jgi:hypothetical protein
VTANFETLPSAASGAVAGLAILLAAANGFGKAYSP